MAFSTCLAPPKSYAAVLKWTQYWSLPRTLATSQMSSQQLAWARRCSARSRWGWMPRSADRWWSRRERLEYSSAWHRSFASKRVPVDCEIGKPLFARAECSFLATSHGRTWINDRSIAGGGPIADVGVHCIDALRYILQDEVRRVTAVGRSDERSGDVEAAAILTLEFRRGTLATVLVSMRAQY